MKRSILKYFSPAEIALWSASTVLIVVSFCVFDRSNYMALTASLIGSTAIIFNAKGNPAGSAIMLVFIALYAVISYRYAYYGEMMTYLGMSAPMAIFALISWLRNPYGGNRAEVRVNTVKAPEFAVLAAATACVTVAFYFILAALGTANVITSTFSVATSFAAAYLTMRRSEYYAFGYMLNDIVLIILWSFAAADDRSYISVIICFVAFLADDSYSFFNWRRMKRRQSAGEAPDAMQAEASEQPQSEQAQTEQTQTELR